MVNEITLYSEEPGKEMTINDVPYFEMSMDGFEGPKVFFSSGVKGVVKLAQNSGLNFFYVIAMNEIKDEKTKKTTQVPTIFKVTKSSSFLSIVPIEKNIFDLDVMKEKVVFTLPKIPWEMIQKIDQFFRAVDDKYGTEATVILTYDDEYNGAENASDGWGFLIPDQENSAVACDYKPESIVGEIPNLTTNIVGTVHSHPGMSAYASSTDHKDQASEDGIHITIGWLASNNDASEYHLELAIDGTNYTLKPEQVFEKVPALPPVAEVEEWMKKVKKKTTSPIHHMGGDYEGYFAGTGSGGYYGGGGSYSGQSQKLEASYYPKDGPSLSQNFVIAIINDDNTANQCPFCKVQLTDAELYVKNSCEVCGNLVYSKPLTQISEFKDISDTSSIAKKTKALPSRGIYVWNVDASDSEEFVILFKGTAGDFPKV